MSTKSVGKEPIPFQTSNAVLNSDPFRSLLPVLGFMLVRKLLKFRFFVGQIELLAFVKGIEAHKAQVKPYFETTKPRFHGRKLSFQDVEIVRLPEITAADVPDQFFGVGDEQSLYGMGFFLPL